MPYVVVTSSTSVALPKASISMSSLETAPRLKSSGLIWKLSPANSMAGMYSSDVLHGKTLQSRKTKS